MQKKEHQGWEIRIKVLYSDAIQEKVTHGCKKTRRNLGVTKKQDLRTCGTEEVSGVKS